MTHTAATDAMFASGLLPRGRLPRRSVFAVEERLEFGNKVVEVTVPVTRRADCDARTELQLGGITNMPDTSRVLPYAKLVIKTEDGKRVKFCVARARTDIERYVQEMNAKEEGASSPGGWAAWMPHRRTPKAWFAHSFRLALIRARNLHPDSLEVLAGLSAALSVITSPVLGVEAADDEAADDEAADGKSQ